MFWGLLTCWAALLVRNRIVASLWVSTLSCLILWHFVWHVRLFPKVVRVCLAEFLRSETKPMLWSAGTECTAGYLVCVWASGLLSCLLSVLCRAVLANAVVGCSTGAVPRCRSAGRPERWRGRWSAAPLVRLCPVCPCLSCRPQVSVRGEAGEVEGEVVSSPSGPSLSCLSLSVVPSPGVGPRGGWRGGGGGGEQPLWSVSVLSVPVCRCLCRCRSVGRPERWRGRW